MLACSTPVLTISPKSLAWTLHGLPSNLPIPHPRQPNDLSSLSLVVYIATTHQTEAIQTCALFISSLVSPKAYI